tara:strand:+ start:1086 stop:1445 length:360 start_codon:yes stop_codon:yes gene_type:complete
MKELESMERHDMPFICTWNSRKQYGNGDGVVANIFIRDSLLFGREVGSDSEGCFFFDLNENMTEDENHDSAAWQVLKRLDLQDIYTLIRTCRCPDEPSYQDKEYLGGWIYVLTRRIVSK